MPVSHIPRTLKLLRERGWEVDVCERRVTSRICRDLFGVFDLLAFNSMEIAGVQVCHGDDHARRMRKLEAWERLGDWMTAGAVAGVISWRKCPEKRGSRRMAWKPREEWL